VPNPDQLCEWSHNYYEFCVAPATERCPKCGYWVCPAHCDRSGVCLHCLPPVGEERVTDFTLGVD